MNTVIPTSSWSQTMFESILDSTSSFSEEKEEEFEEQKIKLDLVAVHGWPHELHIDENGVSMPHVLGSTSDQKLEVEESQLEADTGHQHHQPDVDGLLGRGSWGQQGREYVVQCHNHHCAGARVIQRKSPEAGPQSETVQDEKLSPTCKKQEVVDPARQSTMCLRQYGKRTGKQLTGAAGDILEEKQRA